MVGASSSESGRSVYSARLVRLEQDVRSLGGCVLAYSGGVDSTFLLAVARRALGDRMVAVTVRTLFHGAVETEDACRRAAVLGVRHEVLDVDLRAHPGILANPPDRCYLCKRLIFTALRRRADELELPALVDATNAGDLSERRPGLLALRELGVRSPLADAGLHKAGVRALSVALGIEGANRPSSPCLATRLPYGTPITPERLRRVYGAEYILRALGFADVRVRDYGDLARIELLLSDVERAADRSVRQGIVDPLRDLGYRYVTLDLAGYRTGSMDEVLPPVDAAGRNPA